MHNKKKPTDDDATLHTPQKKVSRFMMSPIHELRLLRKISGGSHEETPLKYNPSTFHTDEQKTLHKELQQRNKVYLVCVQHSLETTGTLLKTLIERGLKKENIFFLDKLYSTSEKSFQKISKLLAKNEDEILQNDGMAKNMVRLQPPKKPWLYGKNIKTHIDELYKKVVSAIKDRREDPFRIILLDDGGRLIELLPEKLRHYNICAVEQTTAGYNRLIKNPPQFPWISVATSNIKRNEDPFIGELAEQRVAEILKNIDASTKMRCGIIGLGNIGKAVASKLIEMGHDVSFYDTKEEINFDPRMKRYNNVEKLIEENKFIIGCTGKNTLHDVNLESIINEDKFFISISSESIEFNTPMKKYEGCVQNMSEYSEKTFVDLEYSINGHNVTFVNAGFPATFDTSKQHAVAPEKIAITRAALFAAIMQLLYHKPTKNDKNRKWEKPMPFNKNIQDAIKKEWLQGLENIGAMEHQTAMETPNSNFKTYGT